MKDFITKATFGFLMGQLFPGAVGVFAISYAYFALETSLVNGVLAAGYDVLNRWSGAGVPQQIFLVALCIALGMAIHGMHWATLGALEHRLQSVYKDPWHRQTLWRQVVTGPLRLLDELRRLFFTTHDIRHASMAENVTRIEKDRMQQFEFLQEFYLASGQFFMHTAYAMTLLLFALATFVAVHGITWRRILLAAFIYVVIGIFFILGRIQLRSLFTAEEQLRDADKADPEPKQEPVPEPREPERFREPLPPRRSRKDDRHCVLRLC